MVPGPSLATWKGHVEWHWGRGSASRGRGWATPGDPGEGELAVDLRCGPLQGSHSMSHTWDLIFVSPRRAAALGRTVPCHFPAMWPWECHSASDSVSQISDEGHKTPGAQQVPGTWAPTFFFFKDFICLFMKHTERQRHRQREKQAPHKEPDAGLDPGSRDRGLS